MSAMAGEMLEFTSSESGETISGLALNQQESDPIYAHMIAKRSFPDDLFEAPDKMRMVRRDLARIKTVVRQKRAG